MDKFRSKVRFMGGSAFTKMSSIKASSASNQFAGRATISSGTVTVTVSTTVVKSNDFFSLASIAGASWAPCSAAPICVRTIAEGAFFTLGTGNALVTANDVIVAWELKRII